jgi:hypothetical protein
MCIDQWSLSLYLPKVVTFDLDVQIEQSKSRWIDKDEEHFGIGFHGWNHNYYAQKIKLQSRLFLAWRRIIFEKWFIKRNL